MEELSFVSCNIHKGLGFGNLRFTLPRIKQALIAWAPDVVCLQEVQGLQQPRRQLPASWGWQSQVAYLASDVFPFVAYEPNAWRAQSHHGNAILTRLPLQRCTNVDLSLSRWERRGLLHAVLELPDTGAPLHVISTHLNLQARHRKRQLALIRAYLEAEVPAGDSIILAGDFNDWRRRAAAGLAADLSEAFVTLHGQPARTFPSFLPMLRLDRVYARNLEAVHAMHHPRHASAWFSDHAALAVRLRLPAATAPVLKRVEQPGQARGHILLP